jgi:hypothetical protein
MAVGGHINASVSFPGKEPGWASGPVWEGRENFTSTGVRNVDLQPVASRLLK